MALSARAVLTAFCFSVTSGVITVCGLPLQTGLWKFQSKKVECPCQTVNGSENVMGPLNFLHLSFHEIFLDQNFGLAKIWPNLALLGPTILIVWAELC